MRLNEHRNTSGDYRRARELRADASPVEKKLWAVLCDVMGTRNLKFRRQHTVHPYITDFACLEARLLVELDGASHDSRSAYDAARAADLKERGFFIMRFSNEEVTKNVEGVVETILAEAERLIKNDRVAHELNSPLPNPPHEGEGIVPSLAARKV